MTGCNSIAPRSSGSIGPDASVAAEPDANTRLDTINKYIIRRRAQLQESATEKAAQDLYLTISFRRYLNSSELLSFIDEYSFEPVSARYTLHGDAGPLAFPPGASPAQRLVLLEKALGEEFQQRGVEHLRPYLDNHEIEFGVLRVRGNARSAKLAWEQHEDLVRLVETSSIERTLGFGFSPEETSGLGSYSSSDEPAK